jgi:hypothetical protein
MILGIGTTMELLGSLLFVEVSMKILCGSGLSSKVVKIVMEAFIGTKGIPNLKEEYLPQDPLKQLFIYFYTANRKILNC